MRPGLVEEFGQFLRLLVGPVEGLFHARFGLGAAQGHPRLLRRLAAFLEALQLLRQRAE